MTHPHAAGLDVGELVWLPGGESMKATSAGTAHTLFAVSEKDAIKVVKQVIRVGQSK